MNWNALKEVTYVKIRKPDCNNQEYMAHMKQHNIKLHDHIFYIKKQNKIISKNIFFLKLPIL